MALINCPECNKQISDLAEICLGCGAPVVKGFRIGNLEVAQYDLPTRMFYDDAKKACEALRKGWRLPTKDELNTLYKNKDVIGGFASIYYWSSTVYGSNAAWLQNLGNGVLENSNKVSTPTNGVRPVRNF